MRLSFVLEVSRGTVLKKKIENLKPKCRRRDNELALSFQVLLFNEKNIPLNF